MTCVLPAGNIETQNKKWHLPFVVSVPVENQMISLIKCLEWTTTPKSLWREKMQGSERGTGFRLVPLKRGREDQTMNPNRRWRNCKLKPTAVFFEQWNDNKLPRQQDLPDFDCEILCSHFANFFGPHSVSPNLSHIQLASFADKAAGQHLGALGDTQNKTRRTKLQQDVQCDKH